MKYFKMQGAGNDYLFFDCLGYKPAPNAPELAPKLCNRTTGEGADGIILILNSLVADCRMEIFNADGSRAKMCGNGVRCVAHHVSFTHLYQMPTVTVETLSGVKMVHIKELNEQRAYSGVEMGVPSKPQKCRVYLDFLNDFIDLYQVDVGNPHAVCFVDKEQMIKLPQIAQELQRSSLFPEGVNVEFVLEKTGQGAKVRVFERGSGETQSCGTGATAVARVLNKMDERAAGEYKIEFVGGTLDVEIRPNKQAVLWGATELCPCKYSESCSEEK